MEKNPAVKYLEALKVDELQQIAEDLQKPILGENSPLRKAAKEIFGEDNALSRIGVAVPLTLVLANIITVLDETLTGYEEHEAGADL